MSNFLQCLLYINVSFMQNPAHHALAQAKKQGNKENTNPVSKFKYIYIFPLS